MSEIFLSYASQDRSGIQPFLNVFAGQGWKVWYDRTIPPGKTWDQVLESALKEARCVVVLWSKNSIESDWVKIEANHAKQRGILVPVLIEDVQVPLAFSLIQAAHLTGWTGKLPNPDIDQLLRAIAAFLPKPASPAAPPRTVSQNGAPASPNRSVTWGLAALYVFLLIGICAVISLLYSGTPAP